MRWAWKSEMSSHWWKERARYPRSHYFQVRSHQGIWMLGKFLMEILVQNPIPCAFQIKFFPARKKLFCSFILPLTCLSRTFYIWKQQTFHPSIWASPLTNYRASSSHMNSPLVLKSILFRLFVLFTLLNLHFLFNSSAL